MRREDFALTVSRLLSAARWVFHLRFTLKNTLSTTGLGGHWLWGQAEHGLDDLHGGR